MSYQIPWLALAGGGLIGLAASLLLALNGHVAGISGIVAGLLRPRTEETAWRAWFVAGLVLGGALLRLLRPTLFGTSPASPLLIAAAGLLVGFGTRLGSGCTSGHGVCGMSRLSKRSLVATLVFMLTGALTTYLVWHVLPEQP